MQLPSLFGKKSFLVFSITALVSIVFSLIFIDPRSTVIFIIIFLIGGFLGFKYVGDLKNGLTDIEELAFGFLLSGVLTYAWFLANAFAFDANDLYYGSSSSLAFVYLFCGGLNGSDCVMWLFSNFGFLLHALLVIALLTA